MKIKRTLFSYLMALALVCVCLLVLPTEAQAASVDDLDFSFNELHQEYAVSLCDSDASGELVIPATYNGYPVTSIEGSAFSHCDGLTSVTIPDSITSIGSFAFYNCTGLTSVHIGDGIDTLTMAVFDGCSNLSSVTIGSGVTAIGQYAFRNCSNLTNVYYGGTQSQWDNINIDSSNTDLLNANIHFTPSVPTEYVEGYYTYKVINGEATISGFDPSVSGELTIPNTLGGYPVTVIGNNAFSNSPYLTTVTIPNGVATIDNFAFSGCTGLTQITIPDSVTSIGGWAFSGCDSLTQLTLPSNITSIGEWIFYDCGLTSITIPGSVTSISTAAFTDCKSLTSVTLTDGVKVIGNSAFYGCDKLKNITLPNTLTTIEDSAFHFCGSLTNVIIPNNVSSIGKYAFHSCNSLTEITLPQNIAAIADYTFTGCGIKEIIIPESVTFIGEYAFNNTMLTAVYYKGTQAQWDAIAVADGNDSLLFAPLHFCIHEYADATCTAPKTCQLCGETEGSKLGHKYSNSWDTTCNVCGAKRSVSLSNTAPTSFKATLTGYNDVKLTWKAGKGANRYYVYYRRVGKTEWKRATITTGLTYTIKDLVANGKYEFKVISYLKDSSGTYKGASTKVLTFSTTRNLKAPSKVTLKLYGYDDVKVSWSKVTNAAGYKVYYKRSTAKSYTYVGFTTGTSIKKANLSDGVKYTFKVVPCTKVNGSYFADDSSKTASITTLKTVSTPKVAKYTSSKVKVSWTDISGESGYQVIVTSDKAGKKVVTSTTTTGKSKVVSTKKGVTYYYKVRAYKTVDGKKIYAPWSAVKAYKLK